MDWFDLCDDLGAGVLVLVFFVIAGLTIASWIIDGIKLIKNSSGM
jgi:hypothetical protein